MQVQYLHWDYAGENVAFEKTCKQEGLGVGFKYTIPGMSEQNGCVECKFATSFNRVCTMLNGGKFNAFLQNGFSAKAANTAMLLENNLLTLKLEYLSLV